MRRTSRARRRALKRALALGAGLLAAGGIPSAAAQGQTVDPGTPTSTPPAEILSNETTLSHWAFVETEETVRAEPSASAARVARLRYYTELGGPEVYLVLKRAEDTGGRPWLQVRLPMRPNGTTGWVPEDALGQLQVNHGQLVIELRKLRMTLYEKGRRVWRSRVGIGKRGTPTPTGNFYVRQRLRLGRGGGPYGVFAFGTSAYSAKLTDWPGGGVIGIHGTNEPRLIPGAISHGCVRVRNGAISKLRGLMDLGTPILIR